MIAVVAKHIGTEVQQGTSNQGSKRQVQQSVGPQEVLPGPTVAAVQRLKEMLLYHCSVENNGLQAIAQHIHRVDAVFEESGFPFKTSIVASAPRTISMCRHITSQAFCQHSPATNIQDKCNPVQRNKQRKRVVSTAHKHGQYCCDS